MASAHEEKEEKGEDKGTGNVYLWKGFRDVSPQSFPTLDGIPIHSVSVGRNHSAFLSKDGQVFMLGDNSHGQLGNNTFTDSSLLPVLVSHFADDFILDVACGARHTGAVTSHGGIWCWGDNTAGQCGQEEEDKYPHPVHVPILDTLAQTCGHDANTQKVGSVPVCALQISCGAEHTMMVSDYSELWAWGSGPQLGLGTPDRFTSPRRVDYLINRRVLKVSCGSQHTVAVVQKLVKKATKQSSVRSGSVDSTRSQASLKGTPDSPVVNGIQTHRFRPQTCVRCKQEIFTYHETSDTCIINNTHRCPLGLDVDPQASPPRHNVTSRANDLLRQGQHKTVQSSLSLDSSQVQTKDLPKQMSLPQEAEALINKERGNSSSSIDSKTIVRPQEHEQSDATEAKDEEDAAVGSSQSDVTKDDQPDSKGDTTQTEKPLLRQKNVNMTISTKAAQELFTDVRSQSLPAAEAEHSPTSPMATSWQEQSIASLRSLGKSRSTFFDENEAKEFLQHCLYGDDEAEEKARLRALRGSSGSTPPQSPLVRKIQENILQYVPSSPAAMQDAVTTFTKNVFSNVRASIDRFGFVANVGTIMEGESLSSKSSSQDSVGLRARDQTMEDMDKLEFVRVGSMPKSTSLGSPTLRAKGHSPCRRRGSLPNAALTQERGGHGILATEVVLDTEIWCWGAGNKGQLGHGDVLDRLQPCLVKTLVGKKVVKAVAGSYHCVALTANSEVYCWGLNSYGQLGNTETTCISTPRKTHAYVSQLASGVAAGEYHSLILADAPSPTNTPYIHYSGKQPGDLSGGASKKGQMTRINCLRKLGWVQQIASGGEQCACIIDKDTTGFITTIHEFACSERAFLQQLNNIANTLLKPLLISEHIVNMLTTPVGMALQLLMDAFFHLIDLVSIIHLEVGFVIENKLVLKHLKFLKEPDKATAVFQHYCKCYTDVLSLGGFDQCAKSAKPFFQEVKEKMILLVSDEKKKDSNNVGTWLKHILQQPFTRLKEYSKIVNKIALKYPADDITCLVTKSSRHGVGTVYTSEHFKLNQIAQTWDSVKQSVTSELSLAENTIAFWDSCPAKLADSLKTPGRRLLRDSKNHPISLQSAGRFSTNVFLLFNDAFVHVQYSNHQLYTLPTVWVEAVQDNDSAKNAIILTTPEESLTLTAPSASEKAEWLWALYQATDKALTTQKNLTRVGGGHRAGGGAGVMATPRDRQATHSFSKLPQYKDAKYTGMWRNAKMHGQGELEWPDGRKYTGKFKDGDKDGIGIYLVPKDDSSPEIYEGYWKSGKMNGYGSIRYANGDVYEGYFLDGKRHGHGIFKQGKFTSSLASIYIGEWANDKRNGYGVHDDILKGQKYMGTWLDDFHHGNGVIVTLDGMYFEGNFSHNKMTGFGLLMTDDNSCYEGEFNGGPNLSGKGTLTLPNGDFIEGSFNGSFTEGIKVNGTFRKAAELVTERKGFTHALGLVPESFGKLCVPPDRKWEEIFVHCYVLLGCTEGAPVPSHKVWERVAMVVTHAKKIQKEDLHLTDKKSTSKTSVSKSESAMDDLEKIPTIDSGELCVEPYTKIKVYLAQALDTPLHPLGKLTEGLVNVYRATYVGVGAHPRLLYHAVKEVKSYIIRIYPIIRLLFPSLPETFHPVPIWSEDHKSDDEDDVICDEEEDVCQVITPAGLLYPLLLPKVYPPLFTLYALYNEKEDEKYWKRVTHWNKQSDIALMAYLGINQKFWLVDNEKFEEVEDQRRVSTIKDKSYSNAVDTLQRIGTSFSPADKIQVIQQTFDEINKTVQERIGLDYLWSMDDLFPVFQYVVVRARVQHLGAEIHFIDDLMEEHLELGELGIMFTTLKACYFQIQHEKII